MTVSIVKSDISGSQMSVGYKDFNQDKAVRKFLVSTTATSEDKEDVVSEVFDQIGSLHNELTSLPLQSLTATRIGVMRWLVTAVYNRSAASGLPQTNTLIADTQTSHMTVQVCASNVGHFNQPIKYEHGLPAGPINMPKALWYSPTAEPRINWTLATVPVTKVRVPFDRGVHPDIVYGKLLGTVNATPFTLFGVSYTVKPNQLRFEGIHCKTVATATGYRYGGYYTLLYRPSGFRHQVPFFGRGYLEDPRLRPKWQWAWENMYNTTNWPAALT